MITSFRLEASTYIEWCRMPSPPTSTSSPPSSTPSSSSSSMLTWSLGLPTPIPQHPRHSHRPRCCPRRSCYRRRRPSIGPNFRGPYQAAEWITFTKTVVSRSTELNSFLADPTNSAPESRAQLANTPFDRVSTLGPRVCISSMSFLTSRGS